jgi:hypothetical protein
MASIRALTNEAQAVLALARQDREEAMRHLHLARQLWSSVDGRVQATRLRLRIARLQLAVADRSGAMAEARAAQLVAEELQSFKLQRQCKTLLAEIAGGQGIRIAS